jgi:hypothetical protein
LACSRLVDDDINFEFRKLYRWGFRQTIGKGDIRFFNSDFCRHDPHRIAHMRNVPAAKQREGNQRPGCGGQERLDPIASCEAISLIPSQCELVLRPPMRYKNDGARFSPGNINSNSAFCTSSASSSCGSPVNPTTLEYNDPWLSDGAATCDSELFQSPPTIDSSDGWFHLLVAEYDKNQLCRLKSPAVSGCSKPAELKAKTGDLNRGDQEWRLEARQITVAEGTRQH